MAMVGQVPFTRHCIWRKVPMKKNTGTTLRQIREQTLIWREIAFVFTESPGILKCLVHHLSNVETHILLCTYSALHFSATLVSAALVVAPQLILGTLCMRAQRGTPSLAYNN